MSDLKNKISILTDGEYNVYPITAAKIVYLDDNTTSVQETINNQKEFNDKAITCEDYIKDDDLKISIEDKDNIFAYLTNLKNEVQELKKEVDFLKKQFTIYK